MFFAVFSAFLDVSWNIRCCFLEHFWLATSSLSTELNVTHSWLVLYKVFVHFGAFWLILSVFEFLTPYHEILPLAYLGLAELRVAGGLYSI